jgi:polyhydroxyalkanoate synthase
MDFSEPGDLGVFIDEPQVSALEKKMAASGGFLDGRDMATTFNLLRSNDLIWSFVVNNYMMGKEPFPFDLLYWNSDSTRLPAKMHSFYLRSMYMNNLLIQKNGLTLGGVPIDLRTITTPSYWISTREDHIAPWRATYTATQLFAGEKTFLLAGSGHIAGIINPPDNQKGRRLAERRCGIQRILVAPVAGMGGAEGRRASPPPHLTHQRRGFPRPLCACAIGAP